MDILSYLHRQKQKYFKDLFLSLRFVLENYITILNFPRKYLQFHTSMTIRLLAPTID